MKIITVPFEKIEQNQLQDVPIPRDWLLTCVYGELEAFSQGRPMGSCCICRKHTGPEYRMRHQLREFAFDRTVYEECRVLITFPVGCSARNVLFTLVVFAYRNEWAYVMVRDGEGPRARDFIKAHYAAMTDALVDNKAGIAFEAYWKRERKRFFSK